MGHGRLTGLPPGGGRRVAQVTFDEAIGLLPLCASIDPALATELYHRIRALNQIDTLLLGRLARH
jgi:hypothetical protein